MDLTQTNRVVEETENVGQKMFDELVVQIHRHKTDNCLHLGADRFCDYWRLDELPEHAKYLDKNVFDFLFKKMNQGDGKTEVWTLRSLPIICGDCPAFVDEQTIEFIKSRKKVKKKGHP